jgi:hypothetical protein
MAVPPLIAAVADAERLNVFIPIIPPNHRFTVAFCTTVSVLHVVALPEQLPAVGVWHATFNEVATLPQV